MTYYIADSDKAKVHARPEGFDFIYIYILLCVETKVPFKFEVDNRSEKMLNG